jgi:hypothetical protein
MKRDSRSANEWKSLIEVLSDLLASRLGATEACRKVVALRHVLGEESNELFLPFVGVESETDTFPLGEVRSRWSLSALDREDAERTQYEQLCRPSLVEASEKLLQYARRHAL